MSEPQLPPDTNMKVTRLQGEIKISIGIRNTIPHPQMQYSSMSPSINGTITVPDDGSAQIVMDAAQALYERLLGPYWWLVLQQMVQLDEVKKKGVVAVGTEVIRRFHDLPEHQS